MDLLKNIMGLSPWILFLVVASGYLLSILTGLFFVRAGLIDYKKIGAWNRRYHILYAPIMPIRTYYRSVRNKALVKKKTLFLALLIFLNNFFLALMYGRILFGLIPFLPLLLLVCTGLGQGALFARQPVVLLHPLLFLEFGGYVFGTTVGSALGVSVLCSLLLQDVTGFSFFLTSLQQLLPWAVLFLAVGAICESLLLRMAPIPEGADEKWMERQGEEFRRSQGIDGYQQASIK